MIENSDVKQDEDYDNSLLYFKNVISYIQLKYSEHIKIENIAISLGLNRSYLTSGHPKHEHRIFLFLFY